MAKKTINDRERAQYRAQQLRHGAGAAIAAGTGMAVLGTPAGREVARAGVLTGKIAGKKAAGVYRRLNTAGKFGVGMAGGGAAAAVGSKTYERRQGKKINYQTRFGKSAGFSAFGVDHR